MRDETIFSINGPIVKVRKSNIFVMSEMVYVGQNKLAGEVISVNSEETVIQVYEETAGLMSGDVVYSTGFMMNAELGPGIMGNIFDGIERPLNRMSKNATPFVPHGYKVNPLDEEKEWEIKIQVKIGDSVSGGTIYAVCTETFAIEHRLIVPAGINGTVVWTAENGKYKINDEIVKIETEDGEVSLTLKRRQPIRHPIPVAKKLTMSVPLITGQRVIDTLFPIAKGGAAVLPGGFGAGKTMVQHQLAKWCDADIIVYVGCGERGNEMTQVLEEFSELVDPKNGRPMRERTIFIANTSNMPVAAREASIYTGVTLAEYYRDMGYDVVMLADSTSRWAEALREISGRLEEMPAEEGYPAYLQSRLSEFYERAGRVKTLCGREGSVTLIGAVSPQGSDFSEPVTQNSKRFTRCFWALDKSLAYERHYPAINWKQSYSEYFPDLDPWFEKNLSSDFLQYRKGIISILNEEERLTEITKLVGNDIFPDNQKLVLEVGKLIRIGFLQQNAFNDCDMFAPLEKQKMMMKLILHFYRRAEVLIDARIPISKIFETGILEKLIKIKLEVPNDKIYILKDLLAEIDEKFDKLFA
jgi:V/A-type H+-transporting ATPase subunit A